VITSWSSTIPEVSVGASSHIHPAKEHVNTVTNFVEFDIKKTVKLIITVTSFDIVTNEM